MSTYDAVKNGQLVKVAFTDGDVLRDVADLWAVVDGEFNGTPSTESEQLKAMLGNLQAGKPLTDAEFGLLNRTREKYAGQLDAFRASPENESEGFVPAAAIGEGRLIEAARYLPVREADADGDDDEPSGAMVALYPSSDVAHALAQDGGEAPDEIHLTLAFLGDAALIRDPARVRNAVGKWAASTPPLTGVVAGTGTFTAGPEPVSHAIPDVPDLPEARQLLVRALRDAGAPPSAEHGFSPHLTLSYDDRVPDLDNLRLSFDHVALVLGSQRWDFPLSGVPRATAMRVAEAAYHLPLREGRAWPPPNLRHSEPHPEGDEADATVPHPECGTCKMFDLRYGPSCWGYGNHPVDEEWVCDSWTADPNWKVQDLLADYMATDLPCDVVPYL